MAVVVTSVEEVVQVAFKEDGLSPKKVCSTFIRNDVFSRTMNISNSRLQSKLQQQY